MRRAPEIKIEHNHNVAEFYTWHTAPCVDKSLTWKKRIYEQGGYSPPNPFTACHQRRPPSFPFPPSDPDDSKVVDVALVEEVEAVVVEEQGPDDSPPPQPK